MSLPVKGSSAAPPRGPVATVSDAVDPVGPKRGGEFLGAGRFVGVALHFRGQIRLDQPQHHTGQYPLGKGD
jgi:hypothetical protein